MLAFDELGGSHAGLGLGGELAPIEQVAFARGEEALAHPLPGDRHYARHAHTIRSQPFGVHRTRETPTPPLAKEACSYRFCCIPFSEAISTGCSRGKGACNRAATSSYCVAQRANRRIKQTARRSALRLNLSLKSCSRSQIG